MTYVWRIEWLPCTWESVQVAEQQLRSGITEDRAKGWLETEKKWAVLGDQIKLIGHRVHDGQELPIFKPVEDGSHDATIHSADFLTTEG